MGIKSRVMSPDDIMTKDEVLEYLKISMNILDRLMKSKELPYVKLERRVLFRKKDIDEFLERRLVK